jgi:hypothetical protein
MGCGSGAAVATDRDNRRVADHATACFSFLGSGQNESGRVCGPKRFPSLDPRYWELRGESPLYDSPARPSPEVRREAGPPAVNPWPDGAGSSARKRSAVEARTARCPVKSGWSSGESLINKRREGLSVLRCEDAGASAGLVEQDLWVIDAACFAAKLSTSRGEAAAGTAAVLIGDTVTYEGRRYVVVGFTPMTVTPPEVELDDPETGTRLWVRWPPVEGPARAALKLVPRNDRRRSGDGGAA